PPTLVEVEQALGGKVRKCELWTSNWRNRVYRVELASGGAALAKHVVRATDANVQYQYDKLGVLERLQIRGLRVPKALALLRAKRVCVMEFAKGKTIQALVWDRTNEDDMILACELAGQILAQIHIAQTAELGPM